MSQTELIYQEWIEALPIEQQMELVARITQRLARLIQEDTSLVPQPDHIPKPHSILELHGLGAKQWLGVDAQSYIDALRNEWVQ